MKKYEIEVQRAFLGNEEAVIKRLKQVYGVSQNDISEKIKNLQFSIDRMQVEYFALDDTDPEKAILKSKIQSKVYQKKYQEIIKGQIDTILDKMYAEEYKTVSEYIAKCYDEGFLGALYSINNQDVPLIFPIDQTAMVRAVQLDSKISQGLYSRLGEDVSVLKKKITAQVSRGISTGMTFKQVAQQLSAYTNIGYNNAIRIARTEGHRVQCQSGMDACYKAQEKGADVVKQWDSTLDARTRDSHAMVDGEIRELDEKFSNGLMFPGDPSGAAAEVINCRCALLQRGRWALGGSFTKMNNFTKQLETFESLESYAEFKEAFFSKENRNYMNYVEKMEDKYGTKNFEKVLAEMTDKEYDHYSLLTEQNPLFNKKGIENYGKSGIMRMGVIKDSITSKSVSTKINVQSQSRHIAGNSGYIQGRSRLNVSLDEAQELVDQLKGTGSPVFAKSGEWQHKERVEYSKYIGIHVNPDTGEETPTKKLMIIYSKTGSHIVPRKDDNE